MKQLACHLTLVLSVAILVLFTNLGEARLWDRDEPRNAGCAWEMAQRGDWVVPVFNHELRTAKPVLLYWLIISAYSVFGVNEFAARFWSAALGVGTVLATYTIGRRLFSPRVALWGAVILASSLMFDVAGRAATPDSVLIFFATMSLLIFVRSVFPRGTGCQPVLVSPVFRGESHRLAACATASMYAMMGLAVLAKGPVGLILPTAVIGMYLLIVRLPASVAKAGPINPMIPMLPMLPIAMGFMGVMGSMTKCLRPFAPLHFLRTCWLMRPLTALAIVLIVALPWYIWVGIRTDGQWLRSFFLDEYLGRATRAMENHGGSVLYYPLAIAAGFFPWSLLLIPAVTDLMRRIRQGHASSAAYIFLACWVGVYVGIFSLAKTKLPSYVTPAYPALALMTACFIDRWTRGAVSISRWWPRFAFGALVAVGAMMAVGLPLAAGRLLPGEQWLGLIGVVPILGGIAGLMYVALGRLHSAAVTYAATAVALTTAIFGLATVRVDRHQQSHILLRAIDDQNGQVQVGSFACLEPSWVFYGGRPIYELVEGTQDDAAYAVSAQGQAADSSLAKRRIDIASFLSAERQPFVITTRKQWQRLRSGLPGDLQVIAAVPYFLKKDQLVLIGRAPRRDIARDTNERLRGRIH